MSTVQANPTEAAATKLMKSRARHFVYSERALATGNPALQNITYLEEEILREAEKKWRMTVAQWSGVNKYDRQALIAILVRAKDRARREAAVIFDDQTTKESMMRFFDSFLPQDLIPVDGAS